MSSDGAVPDDATSQSPTDAGQIDASCGSFEAAWKAGRHPPIEDELAAAPAASRPGLFLELLAVELVYRRKAGECPQPCEYHGRFPERQPAVDAVFAALREPIGPGRESEVTSTEVGQGTDDADPAFATVGAATSASGRFRILRFHDRGALGEVFVARDEELHREVALKQIRGEHADDAQRRARFLVEAEITGGLEHPGIVPVYGLGQHENGRPFYAMRLIQGDNLKSAIERFHEADTATRDPGERALEFRRLLGRFLDVCNAVAYAHSRGVLHRDLKPGNIMLGKFGETLVVDWGLARWVDRPEQESREPGETLIPESASVVKSTEMGERLGTPAYMSPEQAAGRLDEVGPASDVYSLGATLYCLLTGKPPLVECDLRELLRKVENGDIPPPRAVNGRVDRGMDAICRKAMARRPEDRYASPRALGDDIEHWLADEPVSARPESPAEQIGRWLRRHRTSATAAAAALLLVVLVSSVAAVRVAQAERRRIVTQRVLAEERSRNAAARRLNEEQRLRDIAETRRVNAEQRLRDAEVQRVLAEKLRRDAEAQRVLAEGHRRDADEQRLKAETRLARSALDQGLNFCAQGDSHRGLPWLARALQIAPAEAVELRRVISLNLDGWSGSFHRLLGFVAHPNRVGGMAFSPDGKLLATVNRLGNDAQLSFIHTSTLLRTRAPLNVKGGGEGIAFSPDGEVIATAGDDGKVRFWDVKTRRPVGKPLEHPYLVRALAFGPNGKVLATTCNDGKARLWDTATFALLGAPIVSQSMLQAISFSPDGTQFATGSRRAGQLWDTATHEPVGAPLEHPEGVEAIAFSPDGKLIATGGGDGTARLWDVRTLALVGTPLQHPNRVSAVAFSPGGALLATGSRDATARLWNVATGRPVGPPMPHRMDVTAVMFSPDGRFVATASADRMARLWETATCKPAESRLKNASLVQAVAFSPDGKVVATNYQSVQLWNVATLEPIGRPLSQHGAILATTFSPDGTLIATASYDHTVQLWDAVSQRRIGAPLDHDGPVYHIKFSPDGKVLATVTNFSTAQLWNVSTRQSIGAPFRHDRPIDLISFSPDNWLLALTSFSGSAQLLSIATGAPINPWGKRDSFSAVVFSPDVRVFATMGRDAVVNLRDARTSEPIGVPLTHPRTVLGMSFSADGKVLATASEDATARLWDVLTRKPIGAPLQHQSRVRLVVFSPNGQVVATAGDSPAVRLWDTATGKPIGPPLQHGSDVRDLAFSPDSKQLATASGEATARLWTLPVPVEGEPKRIVLWAKVLSGVELDESEGTQVLSPETWAVRKEEYGPWDAPDPLLPRRTNPEIDREAPETRISQPSAESQRVLLRRLDRAIDARPEDGSLYARRARVLLALGSWAESVRDTSKAIALGLAETDPALYIARADARAGLKQWADAEQDYSVAIARASGRVAPALHESRGIARAALGRWAEAEQDYTRAIDNELGPTTDSIHSRRGEARAELGRWADADADFVVASMGERGGFPTYCHAVLQLHRGDIDGFRDTRARMIERFGGGVDPEMLRVTASVSSLAPGASEERARAAPVAAQLVALDPASGSGLELLAEAEYRAGRYNEALECQVRAAEMMPDRQNSIRAWFFRAMILDLLGQQDEARRWLDKSVHWTDRMVPDRSGSNAPKPTLRWDLRLVCALLRREAEGQIEDRPPLDLPANVFQEDSTPKRPASPRNR